MSVEKKYNPKALAVIKFACDLRKLYYGRTVFCLKPYFDAVLKFVKGDSKALSVFLNEGIEKYMRSLEIIRTHIGNIDYFTFVNGYFALVYPKINAVWVGHNIYNLSLDMNNPLYVIKLWFDYPWKLWYNDYMKNYMKKYHK